MSANLVSVLKSIYERSGLPTAVTDGELNIIWKNKASGTAFGDEESLLGIFGGRIPASGLTNVFWNGSLCSFNLLKAEEHSENELYHIVEIVRAKDMKDILNLPEIRDYISYLCAKIKDAAGMISNSADEIYDAVSCGLYDGRMITDRLNTINKNIMSVAKEIVDPDQFYALMDMDERDSMTLSMDREMQRAINIVGASLEKAVKITKNCDRGIFVRMDRSVLETIVAGMTAQCCCAEVYPETLVYSVSRLSDDRAELSVMSVSPEGLPNNVRSPRISDAKLRNIKRDLFFEYICEILCERIGAVFTKSEMVNGFLFKMEFDIISQGAPRITMIPAGYSEDSGRFGAIPLALADFPAVERYKYYDIDAEEVSDTLN